MSLLPVASEAIVNGLKLRRFIGEGNFVDEPFYRNVFPMITSTGQTIGTHMGSNQFGIAPIFYTQHRHKEELIVSDVAVTLVLSFAARADTPDLPVLTTLADVKEIVLSFVSDIEEHGLLQDELPLQTMHRRFLTTDYRSRSG
jgi:hypothetical protein